MSDRRFLIRTQGDEGALACPCHAHQCDYHIVRTQVVELDVSHCDQRKDPEKGTYSGSTPSGKRSRGMVRLRSNADSCPPHRQLVVAPNFRGTARKGEKYVVADPLSSYRVLRLYRWRVDAKGSIRSVRVLNIDGGGEERSQLSDLASSGPDASAETPPC